MFSIFPIYIATLFLLAPNQQITVSLKISFFLKIKANQIYHKKMKDLGGI